MSDFAKSWALSRKRFIDELSGLDSRQLNWRIHPQSLSIGQMAMHVAGVEVSFGSQLTCQELDAQGQKIKLAATQGVVNDEPFPFGDSEINPESVAEALEYSRKVWEPLISDADPAVRVKQIKSALGPMIDGDGAFTRLGFHAAYHQGQAYLVKTAPGFPA